MTKKIVFCIPVLAVLTVLAACSGASKNESVKSEAKPAVKEAAVFKPVTAISESFNTSAGSFFMDKGSLTGSGQTIPDNGSIVTNGDKAYILIHAFSQNMYGANGVEVQWNLKQATDMSDQKFTINFDVFVPAASKEKMTGFQFSFYNTLTANYTPIYSCYFNGSIQADTWCHISAPIKVGQYITYSGFKKNPGEWIFDKVRIQFVTASSGQEIMFNVANLVVSNSI